VFVEEKCSRKMASPEEYYDCPTNPLQQKSPPPSPPLAALPLRGPIYEHLHGSATDLTSDSESAYANDAIIRTSSRGTSSAAGANVDSLRRNLSNLSLSSTAQAGGDIPSSDHRPSSSLSGATIPDDVVPLPAPPPSASQSQRPYWQPHHRTVSNASYRSLLARQEIDRDRFSRPPIMLEDHSFAHLPEERTLWAKHVNIDNYVIVGNPKGLGAGAFVVWNCTLVLDVSNLWVACVRPPNTGISANPPLKSGPMKLIKRYSEFDDLRRKLTRAFPHHEAAMPPLPPKSVMAKFKTEFLEKRKAGLSYFLNCVLLHPDFAASAVLQDWLFKRGKEVRDIRDSG